MSFQQGLAGLNASSRALDTIGNNIANSGTIGYQTGSTQFADVFAASLCGAGSAPVGLGTKVSAVVQQFTQGSIGVTNNPLDLALNGGGFLQMDDGNASTLLFSMAGIPPLAGFFSKLVVFQAAVAGGYYTLAVVGLVSSGVAAYYYLRIIKVMFFDDAVEPLDPQAAFAKRAVILVSVVFVLFFIFKPNVFVDTGRTQPAPCSREDDQLDSRNLCRLILDAG